MSFTETLQSLTGKLLADCTDQELYLALLELVRQLAARYRPQAVLYQRRISYRQAAVQQPHQSGVVRRSPGCTGRCRKAPFGH